MAIQHQPTNPHHNAPPVVIDQSGFTDPVELAQLAQSQYGGLPKEALDALVVDIKKLTDNNFLAFLEAYGMTLPVKSDTVVFVETSTPDRTIDDDAAITRNADEFTIDFSAVEGYTAGTDSFFMDVNDNILVADNNGKEEYGVITAIDKANSKFTAKCSDGATWTVDTDNLSVSFVGNDYDPGTCAPEGNMELRKQDTRTQKLQIIKHSKKYAKGEKYAFCFNDGKTVKWYDDTMLKLKSELNEKVNTTLLVAHESKSGSGAYGAKKYGTLGLFQNIKTNGLWWNGYVTDVAQVQTILAYFTDLGLKTKQLMWWVDDTQYNYLEKIAVDYAQSLGVNVDIILEAKDELILKFGFKGFDMNGYEIRFKKWGLTNGNSPFNKKRIKDAMPKGIIVPVGLVPTEINGERKEVPFLFKVYKDEELKPGQVRYYQDGGWLGQGSCEYAQLSASTTTTLVTPVPEALGIIA